MAKPQDFEQDLNFILEKLTAKEDDRIKAKLTAVKDKLVELNKKNLVKINHSVVELICAKQLAVKGYEVSVEHQLTPLLVSDIFAVKGDGSQAVEIETGYVSPEHALDPITYIKARAASKIARYSHHTGKFSLGTTPNNILLIPHLFIKPPRYRSEEEIAEMKNLCDKYYANPPISWEEIRQARLHTIYIVSVDDYLAWEIDPENYVRSVSLIPLMS